MEGLTQKQEKILAYIGHFMRKTGYPPTVREIGERFKIASSSVFDHLKALEGKGVLKRTENKSRSLEIVGQKKKAGDLIPLPDIEKIDTVETVQIPLLGRVAAGLPVLAEENIEEMLTLPRKWVKSGKIFALKVRGDSMIGDGIHDGDCALIRMQEDADNGDIVVALLENEATVKRFYKRDDSVHLRASNDKYKDIVARQVKILGKVIGLFRHYS